jgi:hypothetical protein
MRLDPRERGKRIQPGLAENRRRHEVACGGRAPDCSMSPQVRSRPSHGRMAAVSGSSSSAATGRAGALDRRLVPACGTEDDGGRVRAAARTKASDLRRCFDASICYAAHMEFALWPIALRADLVGAFRPGEPGGREGPFRTLRQHGWATAGSPVRIRRGGRAAGQLVVFSILNVEAAISARRGKATTATLFAKAAARVEASNAFARLREILVKYPTSVASSVIEAALVPEDADLAAVVRALAVQTEAVRLQRRFAKHALDFHVGRITSAAEGYVVVTSEAGLSLAVPRALARAAHRERVGECLGVLASLVDHRELIVRAVPGIAVGPERDDSYSPFTRARRFEHITTADAQYLRGKPAPLTIQIPVAIER